MHGLGNCAGAAVIAWAFVSPPAAALAAEATALQPPECSVLLDEAVDLTERAYLLAGLPRMAARAEARVMRADKFFFWPPEYFLVEPGIGDAEFLNLRDLMREVWMLSGQLGCGIAFHPVPES